MSEFQDVMKQWRRMCDKMRERGDWCQSAICPLGGKCQFPSTTDSATVERIVMAWAAENPEPVFPTWSEYLEKKFGITFWQEVKETHIDADTAQKLGIEPKEA